MPHAFFDAPIRVVIVDADHRVRESLADLLGLSESVTVVGRAGHVGAAVAQVDTTNPDVVVLDPRLPDVDAGLALIALLHGRERRPGLLVLSSLGCEVDVLARGADCFVSKNIAPQDLIDAILAIGRPPDRPSGDEPARADGTSRARHLPSLRAVAGDALNETRSLLAVPRLVPAWAGPRRGRC